MKEHIFLMRQYDKDPYYENIDFYNATDAVKEWCRSIFGKERHGLWWWQNSYTPTDGLKAYFYFTNYEDYILCVLIWGNWYATV